ncbi:cell number regulator 2-like isoform X2 [Alnus glutinosa]|uniref:cell number regulator 2-like isoform X2 n=1 Tax=Alnus glutinosa TaxID=3517 RepID=UPI002D77A5D4|nr:cell number regulator 2-like isoform X2 [Alnus glutinosa]
MYPTKNTGPKSASQLHLSKWSTGLCGCFEDCSSCCLTCFAPFITFGRNAEILDEGQTSCGGASLSCFALAQLGVVWFYTCSYRTKLRARFSLPKKPCGDFCVHFCCICCAICQEYRELKHRGLDPSKGWVFHSRRMEGGATTPPSIALGMTR